MNVNALSKLKHAQYLVDGWENAVRIDGDKHRGTYAFQLLRLAALQMPHPDLSDAVLVSNKYVLKFLEAVFPRDSSLNELKPGSDAMTISSCSFLVPKVELDTNSTIGVDRYHMKFMFCVPSQRIIEESYLAVTMDFEQFDIALQIETPSYDLESGTVTVRCEIVWMSPEVTENIELHGDYEKALPDWFAVGQKVYYRIETCEDQLTGRTSTRSLFWKR